jgi:pimeloyl-ACP methyl ester carboxylesterase
VALLAALLAPLGALLAAAALALALLRLRLRAPTREDRVVWALTRDGWTLGLGRRLPRGVALRPPLLLVHGLGMNRQAFDFGVERYSLSAHLARAGFDCFALDLRGHGLSRQGPTRTWNLDDHLREDLPAAMDAVREVTGERQIVIVGHSQGALLALAAACLHPQRVRAVAALAPPVHFRQERLRTLVAMRHLPALRRTRRALGWAAPFAGRWRPALADLFINSNNIERPVLQRLLANAIEDLQPGVLDQYALFVEEDSFRSADGTVDYRGLLAGGRCPALFVSAVRDGLAPPEVVQAGFELWGGPKRHWRCGRAYGHADLVLGFGAPEVVFPVVRDFLVEVSERDPDPPPDPWAS